MTSFARKLSRKSLLDGEAVMGISLAFSESDSLDTGFVRVLLVVELGTCGGR